MEQSLAREAACVVELLAAGFQMHVTRPVDPGELAAAVVASISQR